MCSPAYSDHLHRIGFLGSFLHFPLHSLSPCASLILLSRFSHLVFPLHSENCAIAAMSVQYKAVSLNPPLYIVLYCLTPPEFGRYSSLTLCLPYPAWGMASDCSDDAMQQIRRKRNPSGKHRRHARKSPSLAQQTRNGTPSSPAPDHWPLELKHCSN